MKQDESWYTVVEAARYARCGRRMIYNEAKVGRLRAARIGKLRTLRFRPSWIDEWMERCAPVPATQGGHASSAAVNPYPQAAPAR